VNISWIDWLIIFSVVVFLLYVVVNSKKRSKSVAGFLAADRCAGRYLLGTAEGMAVYGTATILLLFEMFTQSGFTLQFWSCMSAPIMITMSLSGFVIYRYRATRAMTLGQFFEMRYSRGFRVYASSICWFSGIVNYGVIPSIGARFFIHFCGFQNYFISIGPLNINLTLAAMMLVLTLISLYFTFVGGQVTVLVADFWQGIITTIIFLLLIPFLWFKFPWSKVGEALILISKPGDSFINPFEIANKTDFNFIFLAIAWFGGIYGYMSWQGSQAYNCSATTPHEAKMAKIVGGFKPGLINLLALSMIPMVAMTILHHPDFADKAAFVKGYLQNTFPNDNTLQTQMLVPVVLKNILPVGLLGCFTAAMLAFFLSNNGTFMHSWGSIFVQDIVCVMRKKPFSQKQHLWYLKLSITFVAVFAFLFGLLFPMTEYIAMFFAITSAIYVGGAGSAIIGGLYWKRGTTAGAWTAMTVGAIFSISAIVLRAAWSHIPYLVENIGPKFPYTSQVMYFWAAIAAIVGYVIVSLLDKKPSINTDKLFHRGEYAIKEEEKDLEERGAVHKPISRLWKLIGVNSHEFSRIDKGLFIYTVINMIWNFGSFLFLLLLALDGRMTDQGWLIWWKIIIYIQMVTCSIGCIWVSIGGLFDLSKMYKRLDTIKSSETDDGRVVENIANGSENIEVSERLSK
jgi:SSS family solute:Na+ symporter